jgi:hypothetical protein
MGVSVYCYSMISFLMIFVYAACIYWGIVGILLMVSCDVHTDPFKQHSTQIANKTGYDGSGSDTDSSSDDDDTNRISSVNPQSNGDQVLAELVAAETSAVLRSSAHKCMDE